jgi:DNA-directed RNA polymerase I and III subunit RPAC2
MPPKKKAPATTAAPEEDVSMADASPVPADVPEPEYNIEIDEQRIRIVSSNPSRYSVIYINSMF